MIRNLTFTLPQSSAGSWERQVLGVEAFNLLHARARVLGEVEDVDLAVGQNDEAAQQIRAIDRNALGFEGYCETTSLRLGRSCVASSSASFRSAIAISNLTIAFSSSAFAISAARIVSRNVWNFIR
jgi:hypothetical protein